MIGVSCFLTELDIFFESYGCSLEVIDLLDDLVLMSLFEEDT